MPTRYVSPGVSVKVPHVRACVCGFVNYYAVRQ
jgi:hypothetical protein